MSIIINFIGEVYLCNKITLNIKKNTFSIFCINRKDFKRHFIHRSVLL